MIISGRKIVPEFMARPEYEVIAILNSTKLPPLPNPGRVHEFELDHGLFKELDAFGTEFPLLVLAAPQLERADLTVAPQGMEVLCAMGDPLNVGSLLRAALAFGVSRVVFLKESASPFHPRALRASSGAALKVRLAAGPSIEELGAEMHSSLVVMDKAGTDISKFTWPKDLRLLIGEEGQGIPAELRQTNSISIPISPEIESLNAVSAASIALYLWSSSIK